MRHNVTAVLDVDHDIPRADPLRAEKRLAAAVLARALQDALATYERQGIWYPTVRDADNGVYWINSADKTPFSYEWICKALNIDPVWLRVWVREVLPGLTNKQKQEISLELGYILFGEGE